MKKTFSVLIMLCLTFFCFSQTILEPEILNKVQASVFEVVTNKAQEGGIEYEKELPFSRLPFSVRNDKYNPIGTAFLTKDGNFYSAAHVLTFTKTQFTKIITFAIETAMFTKSTKLQNFPQIGILFPSL